MMLDRVANLEEGFGSARLRGTVWSAETGGCSRQSHGGQSEAGVR